MRLEIVEGKPLKSKIATIVVLMVILLIITGVVVGGFFIKRWFHYSLYYKGRIEEVVEPLKDRIRSLEKRVFEVEQEIERIKDKFLQ
jgi:uncharacterized protein YlxW (UPF0749 family)